ncbi:MAG: SDR family oxidoreductase [Polyangiaceae bacterium]
MVNYSNKKAVITGGTTGIGLGVARALVERGAEVLVTGRSEASLEAARRELGARAHVVRADSGSMSDLELLGGEVERRLGVVDLVHLNVGYCKIEPFVEVTEASYDLTFATNTKAVFFGVKWLAPLVRDGGAFVFTTSVADELGYPGMSTYSGSKEAIRGFARVFAAELLPRKIRVNAVSPGFVRTPTMGIHGASAEEILAFQREGDALTPMGRNGTVEEIAAAVLFLGFEATFTTGQELVVDGGMTRIVRPHS